MKKRIIVVLLLLALCLLAMTGCSPVKGFEKDIQVILEINGVYSGVETVNIFNNAVLPEPSAPENKVFYGWTTQENWNEEEAASVPVIENKGLVRFSDIKDAIRGAAQSVTLRAVFIPAPRRDLVIAWYSKEKTSGLNQSHIDTFQAKLYQYLASRGYQPEGMSILIRAYDGGVADTCAAISKDGDVDIMLGWSNSNNLTGTGGWTEGVDFAENVGGIQVGDKERYVARISDTELCLKVYAWIQEAYGSGAAETSASDASSVSADTPSVTNVPSSSDHSGSTEQDSRPLVIGWYAKSETSGLNAAMMEKFQAMLLTELANQGYTADTMNIVIRPYEGKVADVQDAVTKDGDVDVMVGMKAFALEGVQMEVQEDVVMGEKSDRRIHRISDREVAKAVFEWLKTDDARSAFKPD
ncbi:MAG: hypothetical protein Q4G00_08365 [Clostridia bacterium]|nr:hypothetical protein [Clostridia bacterium]